MRKDFDLITHKLDSELPYINIYPIGDLHIGSPEFEEGVLKKWSDKVENDNRSKIVIVGDMVDNALKDSKTDAFKAKMRPQDQKRELQRVLEPFRDKILGAVGGNHEDRSMRASDSCPLYDVMCKLDLEDLYRENMAFIKVNLGQRTKDRQVSYSIVLAHGNSRNKTENFSYAIDGMDVFVTGHTHQPTNRFPAKIVIDAHNEVVRMVPFTHIVVPSMQRYGGYALKGMYMPQNNTKIPVITLMGDSKEVSEHWI